MRPQNPAPARREPPNRLTVGEPGLAIIRRFEGFFPAPYLHRKGYDAIGYGHRIRDWGVELLDPPIDRAIAEELLRRQSLGPVELYLNATTRVVLAQHQFDALGSLLCDVGIKAYERSQLRALVNAGCDALAAAEFLRFDERLGEQPTPADSDTGQRRLAERRLFAGTA